LNIALDLYIHSHPGQVYLSSHEENATREIAYHMHQYARNSSNETVEIIRQYLPISAIGSIVGALTQIVVVTNTVESFATRMGRSATCSTCSNPQSWDQVGHIGLGFNGNRTISLDDLFRSIMSAAGQTRGWCNVCNHETILNFTIATLQPTEMMAFRVVDLNLQRGLEASGNLTIPIQLNLTNLPGGEEFLNPLYRLYAIANNRENLTAVLRIGNQWFSTNGTGGLNPTSEPVDYTVPGFENLAMYEQVDHF
jgi:hypothetical protein